MSFRIGPIVRSRAAVAAVGAILAAGPVIPALAQSGQTPSAPAEPGENHSGRTQTGETQAAQPGPSPSESGQAQSGQSQAGQSQAGQSEAGQSEAGHRQTGQAHARHGKPHVPTAQTVEQRIATLHSELKITKAEESDWDAVAQAMRQDAAAMRNLVAQKSRKSEQAVTALDDLRTYEQFAELHAQGLKTLLASFTTLYNSMPPQQQKLTDQVFRNAEHRHAERKG
jgi:hypothetical protein